MTHDCSALLSDDCSSDTCEDQFYYYDDNLEKSPVLDYKFYGLWLIQGIKKIFLSILKVLSYVALVFPRGLKPASNKAPHELHSTAWLDALRGYAAWIVYNSHVIHENWKPNSSFLMQFSCFKVIFRGPSMVDIFFIISGYALSYRMVGFMHARQTHKIMDSLASSAFRRYLRLYLSTAAATFITMILIYLRIATKGEDPQVLQDSFLGNLQFWLADTARASNPFAHVVGWWYWGVYGTHYLSQMWTIPVEFRGSMVLFIFCAATCKMTLRARVALTWSCIVACFWWETHYAGLFLIGMWIADLRQWKLSHQEQPSLLSSWLPLSSSTQIMTPIPTIVVSDTSAQGKSHINLERVRLTLNSLNPTLLKQIPYIVLFMMSFTFITAPGFIDVNSSFPYNIVAIFMPPKYDPGSILHYPLSIGAFLMVFALDNSPLLQKPLMLSFSQFIGELSFGLYAMHNTVRWVVWETRFIKWTESWVGSPALSPWNVLPSYIAMTFILVWAAEGFRRVDAKIVALGKVLQDTCFES